jgi:hypothetical protein
MTILKNKLILVLLFNIGILCFISGQIIPATAILAGLSIYMNKLTFVR